jgi:mannose PTS system EIIA component
MKSVATLPARFLKGNSMIGILLITHGDIGKELLRTAQNIIKSFPTPADYLRVEYTFETTSAKKQALAKIKFLDEGDGVLILTDLFGATPHNISTSLKKTKCCVVSGLNLPMLLRSFNYAHLPLEELAEKASDGGKSGVISTYQQQIEQPKNLKTFN